MSTENLADMKGRQKYCCNLFSDHSSKSKGDLRWVTESQAKMYPSKVLFGQKICSKCRKKLAKLPYEMESSSESCTSDCAALDEEAQEECQSESCDTVTFPEIELGTLNQSLELIGESPLKTKSAKRTTSYLPRKKQKVQEALSAKIDAALSPIAKDAKENEISDEEDSKADEIIQSLVTKYQTSLSRSEKITILTVFASSWSRRKMMAKFGCSQRMATQAKHLVIEKGILSTPNPKIGRTLEDDTANAVSAFYYEDDISRAMPGKKDCFSITKEGIKVKVQKRLVLANLKEIYAGFKDKYPDKKIGFSKFAMLRPKECVLAGASGTHQVCVCTIHNNVKLMITNARMASITSNEEVPLVHYSHALAKMMCNPSLPLCNLGSCPFCPGKKPLQEMLTECFEQEGVDEVQYRQWTATDRSNMDTVVHPVDDFIDTFLEKLEVLKRHDFVAKQQASYITDRKENLKQGEFLVIGDFSENFSFICQDAAQSFHWNNSSATLHPFVYYFKDTDKLLHGNFVLISDCNTHDTVAVHHFQRRLIGHLKEKFPVLRHIVYFSDGCAGQYKNLKNFLNLCLHEEDFGVPAEWHFFATSHGKGPSDGIGGTIKREATKASLQRPYQDQILSPLQLFTFVQSSLPGIKAEFVTAADWNMEEQFLRNRFTMAKTIAGTQKLHGFQPISKSQLRVWEYSNASSSKVVSVAKNPVQELPLGEIHGYLAVEYNGEWWVAYVMEVQPEARRVYIKFLHPHGPSPSYVFPELQDDLDIDVSDVLTTLSPITATGRTYTLPRSDTKRATEALRDRGAEN